MKDKAKKLCSKRLKQITLRSCQNSYKEICESIYVGITQDLNMAAFDINVALTCHGRYERLTWQLIDAIDLYGSKLSDVG